jgi:hypothetical protein
VLLLRDLARIARLKRQSRLVLLRRDLARIALLKRQSRIVLKL